jgi:hypothetical protein
MLGIGRSGSQAVQTQWLCAVGTVQCALYFAGGSEYFPIPRFEAKSHPLDGLSGIPLTEWIGSAESRLKEIESRDG